MQSKSSKIRSKRIDRFNVVNSRAAGIDVGASEMVVAVNPEMCQENVRVFGTFTSDYEQIAIFLQEHAVQTVALESTGVYWVQLYMYLLDAGFEVTLANARHIKNVSGRKDDENDAMWIQKLHTYGLINGSFQPDLHTRGLRDLTRHRRTLVQDQSQCINSMIKALELMNVKVQTVISDIDSKTGLCIIESILNGERDARKLASLADKRIKASEHTLSKSLEGNWNVQQIFLLKQYYTTYQFFSEQIQQTNLQIEQQLCVMLASKNSGHLPDIDKTQTRKRSTQKNAVPFNATAYLTALLQTNITSIPGINEVSAMEIISEIGTDMSKWKTEKHFTSWLNLVPNTKKSGGKIISSKVMKKKHRAGQVFRIAASTLWRSKTPLGDFFRSKQAKGGPSKAILATATKMAISLYIMIRDNAHYQPEKLVEYHNKSKQARIRKLENQLAKLKDAA